MLSEENQKLLAETLMGLLKDTSTIIGCLQAVSEAKKLKGNDEAVPQELITAENVLHSLSLKLSLEKNHEDTCAFLEEMLKDMGQSTEEADKLETETTDLLGY